MSVKRWQSTRPGSEYEAAEGDFVEYADYEALAADAKRDYDGMREFQAKFIAADHRVCELEAQDGVPLIAEVIGWKQRAEIAESRVTALEAALIDYGDHGLRFDLNPTHDLRYAQTEEGVGETSEQRLTKRQAAVIGAFTGICCGPFSDIHEYVDSFPEFKGIMTHNFADKKVWEQIKAAAKPDFMALTHEPTQETL